jgi:transcriptional regulator with XRE-family HTH domain
MSIIKKVAQRIKKLREAKGLTIEKLAYANDMSKGNLSEIERGMIEPKLVTLEKIAKGLDVSLKEFFDF